MRFFQAKTRALFVVEIGGTSLSPSFALTFLESKGKHLSLQSHSIVMNWEETLDLLPNEGHIIWLINDEAVLCKAKLNQSIASLFPNLERASFFISETDEIVSICRKTHWHFWKEKIEAANKSIAQLSLGICPLGPFKDVLPDHFYAGGYQLTLEEKQLVFLEKTAINSKQTIDLGDNTIAATAFLGFAAVVDYLSKSPFTLSAVFLDLIQQKREDPPANEATFVSQQNYLEQVFLNRLFEREFVKLHRVIFGIVLVLGCVLFIWSTNSRLQFNSLSQQQRELHMKIQQKEALLEIEKSKWEQIDHKSQHQRIPLLDQLVHAMPNGIQLDKIVFTRAEKNPAGHLLIRGNLTKKSKLTQWTDEIRLHEKVKNISILQLTTDAGLLLHFELQIRINDEYKK